MLSAYSFFACMVAKVLQYEANELKLDINNVNDQALILTKYNGGDKGVARYGNYVNKYAGYFKNYKLRMIRNMRKRAIERLVFFGLVFVGLIYYLLWSDHWTLIDTKDNTRIEFQEEITTTREGLDIAYERAKEWRPDVKLSKIIVSYDGRERIESQKGLFRYCFFVVNSDWNGYRYAACFVDLDIKEQAIVNFHAYGGDEFFLLEHDVEQYDDEIDEIFEAIKRDVGLETILQYEKPFLWISSDYDIDTKRYIEVRDDGVVKEWFYYLGGELYRSELLK